jgi:pimeloyl-ACP methyl ester carboxylesterase
MGLVQVGGHSVAVFAQGKGPVVLLVHGWQSNRERLGALAEGICTKGYTAVSWDMPAHGESRGRTTSLAQFVEAIFAVQKLVGPVHSIVGHSLGGTAAALALHQGLSVQAGVFVAPMISFDFALDQFQKVLRLSSPLRELTAVSTESRVNLTRSEADLLRLPSPSCRVLLIHDEQDQRTPVMFSYKLAERWAPDEFLITDGLGHSRLLFEASVLDRVARFVGETSRSEGST